MAMRFKLVGGGSYVSKKKTYLTGDEIISDVDLVKKHNTPVSIKFLRIFPDVPDAPVIEKLDLEPKVVEFSDSITVPASENVDNTENSESSENQEAVQNQATPRRKGNR